MREQRELSRGVADLERAGEAGSCCGVDCSLGDIL